MGAAVALYRPKTRPFSHQTEAISKARQGPPASHMPSRSEAFAYLMDMGTGKSKVVCDEFGERYAAGELDGLLIWAPAGCYRNWWQDRGPEEPSEFTKHFPTEFRESLILAPWISGKKDKTYQATLRKVLEPASAPRILVMNVEALSYASTGAREICELFLKSGRMMIAFDESTTGKDPGADRTKQIMKIGKLAAARRILTGFPTPKSPLDLFAQFAFLDPRILRIQSYWAFRARYAVQRKEFFGGRWVWIIVGYQNTEELHSLIAPYSYRKLKEECLDLPPKVYAPLRDVKLTDEQERMYDEIKEYATTELASGDFVTATEVIVQLIRLHQVLCGFVTDENGITHAVPSHRLAALMEVINEHEGKAIIWCGYNHNIREVAAQLRKEYGEDSVAVFYGENKSTRHEDEARFKTDPRCRFMVASPGAGGRGNTWTVADLCVYYSNNDNLEHRLQSEDRPHRAGQDKSVTYVDLRAVRKSGGKTVDDKIVKSHRAKINMATKITGDNYREWLI